MAWASLTGDYEVIDIDLTTGEIIRSTGIIKFPAREKVDPESL